MTNFYKDERIAEAIKTAIRDFGKKNSLNGMDYFAEKLGFKGANRSVQLHNHISHKNIEKDLKLTQIFAILEEMDEEEHETILSAFGDKYGFVIKAKMPGQKPVGKTIETIVTVGILEIGGTIGVIDDDVLQSIKDGEIDQKEAKRILRSLSEMEGKTRGLRDALIDFLGE